MQETPTPEMNDAQIQQYLSNKQFDHQVQGDTLQGLAIRYGINPEAIRKFNNLTTNEIYHLKTIIIPDQQSQEKPNNENSLEKMFLLQYFINNVLDLADKSEKVAKYYLDISNWDLNVAQAEYEEDKKFDK